PGRGSVVSCRAPNRWRLLEPRNHSIAGPHLFQFRVGRRPADRTPTRVLLLGLRAATTTAGASAWPGKDSASTAQAPAAVRLPRKFRRSTIFHSERGGDSSR